MLAQALQHVSFCDPLVTAQSLSDETSQLGVAVGQPPTWCHTIGLVLELLWCQIIKVLQQCTSAMTNAVVCHAQKSSCLADLIWVLSTAGTCIDVTA